MTAGLGGLFLYQPEMGFKALSFAGTDGVIILSILPPILVLIGLLDVWIPKEVIIRYLGKDSGFRGIVCAFFLGAVTVGPLFIAFPIAAMLAGKGARLANILIFIGIWTSVKLPMILFEYSFLGGIFTLVHVMVNIALVLTGSFIIEQLLANDAIQTLESMAMLAQRDDSKKGSASAK